MQKCKSLLAIAQKAKTARDGKMNFGFIATHVKYLHHIGMLSTLISFVFSEALGERSKLLKEVEDARNVVSVLTFSRCS